MSLLQVWGVQFWGWCFLPGLSSAPCSLGDASHLVVTEQLTWLGSGGCQGCVGSLRVTGTRKPGHQGVVTVTHKDGKNNK